MIKFKVTTNDDFSCFIDSVKYGRYYPDNETMTADSKTLGYFLFSKKWQATLFMSKLRKPIGRYKIKRVETLDTGKRPHIISGTRGGLDEFYRKCLSRYESMLPPQGTICHFKIRVLEECKS